jgi:cytochrome c oxidase accessory protein FixG
MKVFSGSRKWVYPLQITGRFSTYHRISSVVLFGVLGVVPFLRLDGRPMILLDVPGRQVTFFSWLFTATDGVLIMILALLAAFSLFFFTAIFGRLWCGYACPQSVFMINLVFRLEAWLEGPRAVRQQRARGGWTWDRAWRSGLKHAVFLGMAWLISMAFMGFFVPTDALWSFRADPTAYGIVGFFTALWFLDFAWFREQTCNYVCPYARFQSALTDRHSWIISYDAPRGEPRGKEARARGGCIDCHKCVTVCPQGIDIRDGFQLECIACGKCVDACESVMPKLGHPTLVRYSTMALDQGRPHAYVRARTVAYGALLSALALALLFVVGTHKPLELLVDRMPGSLFIEDADGYVRNTWFVQVLDRTLEEGQHTYDVAVRGLPEGSQVLAQPLDVRSTESARVPLVVRVPREAAPTTLPVTVEVSGPGLKVSAGTTFKGPGPDAGDDEGEED